MKAKKLFKCLSLVVTPLVALPLVAASCVDSKKKPQDQKKPTPQPKPKPKPQPQPQPTPTGDALADWKKQFPKYKIVNSYQAVDTAVEINRYNIFDGDTFQDIEHNDKVRFAGIDTPEISKAKNPTQKKYGIAAKTRLAEFMAKSEKTFVVPQHTNNGFRGDYGRVIAIVYAYIDKKWVNVCLEMVRLGFGKKAYISINHGDKFYTPNTEYYNDLLNAEREARNKKLGIWKNSGEIKDIYPHK
ncbi:micrococcal nuclease [Metamycoplasma subdolum]|uniref:Micrococcal nuclease n=1 Tax=Metamycoplasma subdolum TaxID=92407 RepID=A0A3M0A3L1_9BACT|nr:thermonuclease family protein [Metamycoplasma subdolum]RMA79034.1 micrococcal nuclease [Metamycoplasma subdolum]WPB50557.1 thermonuclease family protein [Metamycoplasma subdolum]